MDSPADCAVRSVCNGSLNDCESGQSTAATRLTPVKIGARSCNCRHERPQAITLFSPANERCCLDRKRCAAQVVPLTTN